MNTKIETVEQLIEAADKKKAVCWSSLGGSCRTPAAFMIGMPCRTVYLFIKKGLYIYEKEVK